MPLIQNEVGPAKESLLYVWSTARGKPGSNKAVITAHGGTSRINGMANAPACDLVYYAPHGHILEDPSLFKILARQVEACGPVVKSRASQDYELGKYTNSSDRSWGLSRHNKGSPGVQPETYGSIASLQDTFLQNSTNHWAFVDALQGERTAAQDKQLREQSMLAARFDGGVSMDVVSLRRRFWKSDPKLSDVLNLLWKYGYAYSEVHCNFCRGGGKGYSPLPSRTT